MSTRVRTADAEFLERLSQTVTQTERTGETVAVQVLLIEPPADTPTQIESFLLEVARRIDLYIRVGDAVAYLGDGWFTVLLQGIIGRGGATVLARSIVDTLSEPFSIKGEMFHLRISTGLGIHTPGIGPSELLSQAEESLRRTHCMVKTSDRPAVTTAP